MSLVELIAVIAIAGLLSTLVLLGIARSIERARTAGCSSNLRQLYQGFMLYSHDYGRVPFGPREPADTSSSYYGGQFAIEFKEYIPGGRIGGNTGHAEPYLCPSDNETRAGTGLGWLGHSYGVNQSFTNPLESEPRYYVPYTWEYPSETLFLADSTRDVISRSSPNINLAPRHRGGANTLFLDGHVEWLPAPFPNRSEAPRFWLPAGR